MAPADISGSPGLVPNPFIKKRNLEWHLSPPPTVKKQKPQPPEIPSPERQTQPPAPSSVAIEAGKATLTDHLPYFSQLLSTYTLGSYPPSVPRLPVSAYESLYSAALHNPNGAHFVVHQHDHPVAGTHYDLRLQINGTSSASWAIMYGLPGDPNSQRLNRNAAETRIHTLWNHLVETGSRETGSLLIWDTGTYQILPRRSKHAPAIDPDSEGNESEDSLSEATTEQEKLHAAFANRKIRLRLNGTRLPRGYTVYLRVTKKEDATGRMKALKSASGVKPRRRRARRGQAPKPAETSSSASESEPEPGLYSARADQVQNEGESEGLSAVERELREVEVDEIRRTNAYTGASNTISSVYQRRWYLSLDRSAAGFVKMRKQGGTVWEMGDGCSELPGSAEENDSRLNYPFYVKGPEHERSVVTGRLGQEILRDEGVSDYAGRKGWCPVLN